MSKSMSAEEAEYLRMVELGGIGRRPYTNLRLRVLTYGLNLPSYKQLVEYEKANLYPIKPFYNGWKGELPAMIEVTNQRKI